MTSKRVIDELVCMLLVLRDRVGVCVYRDFAMSTMDPIPLKNTVVPRESSRNVREDEKSSL